MSTVSESTLKGQRNRPRGCTCFVRKSGDQSLWVSEYTAAAGRVVLPGSSLCSASHSIGRRSHPFICRRGPRRTCLHQLCLVLGLTVRNVPFRGLGCEFSPAELTLDSIVKILRRLHRRIKVHATAIIRALRRAHSLPELHALQLPFRDRFTTGTSTSSSSS